MPKVILPPNPYWEWIDESTDGRGGTAFSWTGDRKHTRKYKIKVKLREMSEIAVSLCPGLPLAGSPYVIFSETGAIIEQDPLALLTDISAVQQETGQEWAIWVVTCEYNTKITSRVPLGPDGSAVAGAQAAANDPTQELPDVEWDMEMIREGFIRDLLGFPVENTAHQTFIPGLTRELPCPVLIISRNEPSYNHQKAASFVNGLNQASFLGAPPGCVQVGVIKSKQKNKGMFLYNRTTYRLRFRPPNPDGGYILPPINIILPKESTTFVDRRDRYYWEYFENKSDLVDSWQPTILNQGMYRLGGTEPNDPVAKKGKLMSIIIDGAITTHNQPLDQFGGVVKPIERVILDGIPPVAVGVARMFNPWYIRFTAFRNINLNGLITNGVG